MTTENTLIGKMVDLFDEPESSSNIIDIDFDIAEKNYETITRNVVEKNSFAVLNAYRMWLASRRGDYIREAPDESGYFQFSLNDKYSFESANENLIRQDIISLTSQRFPLLRVIECTVKANYATRKWDIKVIIEDLKSGNFIAVQENLNAVTAENSRGYLEV